MDVKFKKGYQVDKYMGMLRFIVNAHYLIVINKRGLFGIPFVGYLPN